MLRVLLPLVVLGLSIYTLIDCVRTDRSEIKNLPKPTWILLILFLWVIGPIAWLLAGRERTRGAGGTPTAPPRPIAPDDDPDFLRNLEIDMKRPTNDDGDAAATG